MGNGVDASTPITEQIANHLGREIVSGARSPSSRIQELAVAKQLGVSRGSVREALLLLESRHLIEILPRRGALVTQFSESEIIRFSNLYEDLLERLFADIADSGVDLGRFTQAYAPLQGGVPSVVELIDARHALLLTATNLSSDQFLVSVVRGLLPVAERMLHLAAQHRDFDLRDSSRFFGLVLDALTQRDGARLREIIPAFVEREKKLAIASLSRHTA